MPETEDTAAPARPLGDDHRDTVVAAARRLMALHPDIAAVAITVVSTVIDPRVLATTVVGAAGPPATTDVWLLSSLRLQEAVLFCHDQAKGMILGLDDLATNLSRRALQLREDVELLRAEKARLEADQADADRRRRGAAPRGGAP